jgi:phospholipid/cholesterol/gamma-HCH transport system substrate-binding protein
MTRPTNHYKVGLFVITGFTCAVVAAVALGATKTQEERVGFHSYFNESVQGLELGSPVKFRGVSIGNVSSIQVAPDHRLVEVVSNIDLDDLKRVGLAEQRHALLAREQLIVPPDLRAQLGSQGITGVKFIAIDFFDQKGNPPPELSFAPPPDRYIPAAPSVMKNLEDTLTKAMDRLPDMVDAVELIMGHVDRMLVELENRDVVGKVATTLDRTNDVMVTARLTLARIDKQNLGEKAAGSINELTVALTKMTRVIDRLDGEKGLLASAQHATDAFGDMGRDGRGTQKELEETLRDVSEAAAAIRSLSEALERDPDMLIKGKYPGKAWK